MFWNQYPYLNINDLNLDFILKAIGEMQNEVTNFVSINAIKYADPIQWDITRQYEKNTIVIDPVTGTAYISVAPVPAGVALTRPEYWTVVFDLSSFVTKTAKNFTDHFEADTTLTATFNSNAGEWLVWGDVLYKALVNITAGDAYVVNGNIQHFTIEDLYNEYLQTVGDLANLITTDKSNLVNAINEVDAIAVDLYERHPYLASFWTEIWIDAVNGDDNNDGLSASAPLQTMQAVFDKYMNAGKNAGGYISSFTFRIVSSTDLPIDVFQGVSNVQLHFYNESNTTLRLLFGNIYHARTYNSYWHFAGDVSAPIILDMMGDDTFGGDNNAYWFEYTTVVNSGANITNLFNYAKGCEFTFQNSGIDDTNINVIFRDSNVFCTGTCNFKPKMRLYGGSFSSMSEVHISTMQLNECRFNIIGGSLYAELDTDYRNYVFSGQCATFNFNQGTSIHFMITGAYVGAKPFFSGFGNTINIPYNVTLVLETGSQKMDYMYYGCDNILNVVIQSNILDLVNNIAYDSNSKSNVVKSVYGAFHKSFGSATMADLNGQHFDEYFTGHFLSLNIGSDCHIMQIDNNAGRMTFVRWGSMLGEIQYVVIPITLTNTPAGGCTINVGTATIQTLNVTNGTATTSSDLSGLSLKELNMF